MDSEHQHGPSKAARMVRTTALTPDFLRHLPYLLPLAVVIEITGLTKHGVRSAVEAGSLRQWKLSPNGRKAKYYREEVLRLIGVDTHQIRPNRPDWARPTSVCSTGGGGG